MRAEVPTERSFRAIGACGSRAGSPRRIAPLDDAVATAVVRAVGTVMMTGILMRGPLTPGVGSTGSTAMTEYRFSFVLAEVANTGTETTSYIDAISITSEP